MSSPDTEPPDRDEDILAQFLMVYDEVRSRVTFDQDADTYIREFLRRGSDEIRAHERRLGLPEDPRARDIARTTLVAAAGELLRELSPYAETRQITRDDLATIFQQMCVTGYPPFCKGTGLGWEDAELSDSSGAGAQWQPELPPLFDPKPAPRKQPEYEHA